MKWVKPTAADKECPDCGCAMQYVLGFMAHDAWVTIHQCPICKTIQAEER